MKKMVPVYLVLVLFLFSFYVGQSVNEAHAQVVATGASGETGVQGNGFSTGAFRTVQTDAAGPQAGTVKAGVPGESAQGEKKREANPQAPKAPAGLRILKAN